MLIPNIPSAYWAIPGLGFDRLNREDVIINEVCKYFNIDLFALKMRKKTKEIAYARLFAMYLLCTLTELSLKSIGKIFVRHHTSILYGREEIAFQVQHNELYKRDLEQLLLKIGARIKI